MAIAHKVSVPPMSPHSAIGEHMRIEYWSVDQLVAYARNPRKNDAAVDRMVASIREFGFKIPVLARSDGEVVDGHLLLKAAKKLSIHEVPVILCDEWTPAQVKSFPPDGEPIGRVGRVGRGRARGSNCTNSKISIST
jgi:hypothetical protein